MMVAFVLGEVAAYQMGMTVWFIIAAALFVFHRKLCPMKHKAHSFSPAVIKTAEGRGDSDFQTDAERVWNWKDPMMCRVFLLFFCFLAGWGRMTVEMRPDALERMVTQKGGSDRGGGIWNTGFCFGKKWVVYDDFDGGGGRG